jgi:hypothetical protein
MNPERLPLLAMTLPLATKWAEAQEQQILAEGVALTAKQALDAQLAGVDYPDRVRLLKVKSIPVPEDPILRNANDLVGLVSPFTAGITFGYGIYIRADLWADRGLVAHELVHVGQYERLGSIETFLRSYLEECLSIGYPNGSLEQEAVRRVREICS